MHTVKRSISLLLFGLVLANPVLAVETKAKKPTTPQESTSVYGQIKNIYLPAIGMLADDDAPVAPQQQPSSSWWPWSKKEEPQLDLTVKPLSEADQKTMAFDLLNYHDNTQPSNFLSEHSWEDLELFKQANLLKTINRTRTSFGEAVLGKMLVTGGDVHVALARQAAIKELVANPAELNRIDAALTSAGNAEAVYLSNFKNEDPAYEEYFSKLYFGSWTSKVLSNESAMLLEAKTRWDNFANTLNIAGSSWKVILPYLWYISRAKTGQFRKSGPPGEDAARLFTQWSLEDEADIHMFNRGEKYAEYAKAQTRARTMDKEEAFDRAEAYASYQSARYCSFPRLLKTTKWAHDEINNKEVPDASEIDKANTKVLNGAIYSAAFCLAAGWFFLAKSGYNELKYQMDALNYLQNKLIPLGTAIRALDNLRSRITHSEALRSAMPHELKKLHKAFGSGSQKLDELVRLLNTDTFTGSATMLSLQGRVLAAHKLMQEVKYELRDALEALGTIDAIASMAKLVNEFATQDNKYCFVTFTNETQPHLKAVNFWNPLVSMKKPVPNTIELGASGKNRNMILTGQNTAGKSTTLRSLLQGVLLAHVFGVAPAQAMELTPFQLIRTHINIKDDVEHGVSHYQAEVNNVLEMQNACASLQPNERCFIVIDELFHTTGPQTAVPLARKYFLNVGAKTNVMVISSTHFAELVELEKETNGVYKNYKMEIHKQTINGKTVLIRPHKIEEGWTTANVAEDILAEQGVIL